MTESRAPFQQKAVFERFGMSIQQKKQHNMQITKFNREEAKNHCKPRVNLVVKG
jgi:hypothetical protein